MMDDFRFVRCPNCGWGKNPRKPCFNCGDKAPAKSTTSSNAELTAAKARIAELERVNAVMDEELRTKTQALFDLEKDNEHLLASCAQLQKTGGDRQQRLEVALRDCLHALTLASRSRAPAAQRAAALLNKEPTND